MFFNKAFHSHSTARPDFLMQNHAFPSFFIQIIRLFQPFLSVRDFFVANL